MGEGTDGARDPDFEETDQMMKFSPFFIPWIVGQLHLDQIVSFYHACPADLANVVQWCLQQH